jgi:hypothetical protein
VKWAIEQRVDIINMSFGFDVCVDDVRNVLKKARDGGIIVFAAMSNNGRHRRAAWPARTAEDAIGIHSCEVMGKTSSDFTPDPVPENRNFMVVGEKIIAHQLTAKGGGFTSVEGTSFATPVAVSMAAMILGFANQEQSADVRDKCKESGLGVENLRSKWGMRNVLYEISDKLGGYSWITPQLIWSRCLFTRNDYQQTREEGWRVICTALHEGP